MPLHDEHRSKHYCYLNKEEIANPKLVIDELFDFAHLPDVRELLWEWLKTTVTGSYTKTLTAREREAIIILYEKMEKLVEVAHVLHEFNQPKTKKRMAHKGTKAQ